MLLIQTMKKDFLAYRKTLLWIPFYVLLFPVFFIWITDKSSLYFLLTQMCTYMWLGSVLAYDEKYKAETITGILPVKRSTVLLGKLVMSDLVFVGITIIYMVLSMLNTFIPPQIFVFPSWENIIGGLLFSSFMIFLIMPICYKWGYQKSRIILIFILVFIMMLFTGIIAGVNTVLETTAPGMTVDALVSAVLVGVPRLMLIISVALQSAAYLLSYRLIQKRDV